jgi:ATP-dependent Clp protease ATP-binding subunit ClpA
VDRPEFLNRLDEIIVFRQLTKMEVKQIADIMLKEVFKRAEGKGIKIDVTERFKVWTTLLSLFTCLGTCKQIQTAGLKVVDRAISVFHSNVPA